MDEKGYDITGYNIEDMERKYETPYELEESDRESMSQIRKAIEGRHYKSKEEVHGYLLYLEHLRNKLMGIQSSEGRGVIVNQSLTETVREISELLHQVKLIHDKLYSVAEGLDYVLGPHHDQGHVKSGGSFQGVGL